jgi:hypothetical protein
LWTQWKKKLFTKKIIILALTTTLTGILLRIIIKLMEIELSDLFYFPFTVICTIFSITYIQLGVKSFVEEVILPQYLFMDNPTGNTGGAQQENTDNTQENNNNTVFQGNGFTCQNGIYDIHDPTNIRDRGYLDPTRQPFNEGNQPFARNLAAAMTHEYDTNKHMSLASNIYGPGVERFLREFMAYTYPTRPVNMYFNSNPVRKTLRNLP